MSEEEQVKPVVCEKFEPQAWRKTVCKNCFQPPDVHVAGSGQNGVEGSSGRSEHDRSRSTSAEKSDKTATSLKSKFEQLELEKFKPKDSPHTLPRMKKSGNLALITEKYDELDRIAGKLESPTKAIPPPTAPKTFKKSADGTNLAKSKFGSLENVSSDDDTGAHTLSSKFKFGSMENISLGQDKKKELKTLPTQKSKLGGSVENITISFKSKTAEGESKSKKTDLLNKLDMFQNEVKSGAMSKAGQTVIHEQKDGKVDIINLPGKSKDKDSKKIDQQKDKTLNDKKQPGSKFEKPELKSAQKDTKETGPFSVALKHKSSENKSDTPKDSKSDFKLGLKSVQQKEDNKLASLKDKLAKPEEKSVSKLNQDNKFKTLADKGKEDSGKVGLKLQDTSKADGLNKGKINFKDQLKSPESESSPLSKYKDKMKSQTTDHNNKQAPSWKDKLKSSSKDTENKDSKFKDQLKSTTTDHEKTDKDKRADLKLKVNLKSTERDELKTPDNKFKDQLKPSTPDNKLNQISLKANLKSPTADKEKETGFKLKVQLKSPAADKQTEPDFKLKTQLKSPTPDKDKQPEFKLRGQLKSPTPDKEKEPGFKSKALVHENESKSKEEIKTPTESDKLKSRTDLKKSNDGAVKDSEQKLETKNKFELPTLKSSKLNSIGQDSKPKSATTDVKGSEKLSNKFEPKFKLNKDPKPNTTDEKDKVGSKKFELPKLKSSKSEQPQEPKSNLKSRFELNLKSNEKSEQKSKYEIPSLKKIKSPEPEQTDVKPTENEKKTVEDKTLKDKNKTEKSDEILSTSKDSSRDFQKSKDKEESRIFESKEESDLKKNTPNALDINKNFDIVSSDNEAVSGDACAEEHTREKSPLHVDTQVFTSSRSKTAGVSCIDENHFDSTDNASGFSNIDFTTSKISAKEKLSDRLVLQNGDIASEHDDKVDIKGSLDTGSSGRDKYNESEIEQLKTELLIMTERCQNLEKENEMLRNDLNKKGATESSLKQQRQDVENAIMGLRDQLNSMEQKCSHLESENINLMNDLKIKHEINQSKPHTKETDEIDERLTSKEKIMEDLIDENEQLKQEINELKVEMEEMYDSFRDQEAEEFREIQKELEYTAKNCRILQFKLRKMERKNEQIEQDRSQFEEKLRKLQNSFQDRDAVAHIRSLEDELRMAKEVSVRLHDELDLMEDRRSKVEEENRHITELLEQSDRKQFRLELEVDKLRDKVLELRQELRAREGGPEGEEPRN